MAILSVLNPTLLDVTKRLDPQGNIDMIAELLAETNEVLEDMTFIEGNLPTGHKTTVRSGLPEATWRKLNYGVQPSKSRTVQVTDNCGMLEAYAEVDKSLADLNGNSAAFRLSEDRAFIEAMNKEMAQTLFYGNEGSEPEAFTGFAPRFGSKTAENGSNLIDGGGVNGQTDCSSIYLVVWGPNTVHGIYPKGSKAGLQTQDLGEQTLLDAANGRYQGYRTHYKWDTGLTVRDWRYVVRIHSIDNSTLTKNAASGSDLIDLMTQALEIVPSLTLGRPVFYCSRNIRSFLRRQITNKVASSTLSMDTVAGKKVVSFDGVPVKRCDGILSTEASLN
jgi:hypothetical protein